MNINNKKLNELELKNISVDIENKEILKNINIKIKSGEIIVIMGPNGAGKSSIGKTIMGHPKYNINSGNILLNKENITNLKTEERSQKGIYMSFQEPISIEGITMSSFLRTTYNNLNNSKINAVDFFKLLDEKMELLEFDKKFKSRDLNLGFSGGEKKKTEILQLMLFKPKFAILDEIDSGLDVDALKIIGKTISDVQKKENMGLIIITHHKKILEYLKADKIIILKKGKIEKIGDMNLLNEIEEKGFEN